VTRYHVSPENPRAVFRGNELVAVAETIMMAQRIVRALNREGRK